MISEITTQPSNATPLPGAPANKVAGSSGTQVDRNQDATSASRGTYDVCAIQPPPITAMTIDSELINKYYLTKNEQYPKIFFNTALGLTNDKAYQAIFAWDMGNLFGDQQVAEHVSKQLDIMINEMKAGFEAGKIVETKDLQTKFTINETEFSFDELLKAKGVMEYAQNLIGGNVAKDYHEYADIGIAIGYAANSVKSLTDEQAKVITDRVNTMARDSIELAQRSEVASLGEETSVAKAEEVVELFATMDFADSNAVHSALQQYGKLYKSSEAEVDDSHICERVNDALVKIEGRKEYTRMTVAMLTKGIDKSQNQPTVDANLTTEPQKTSDKRPQKTTSDLHREYVQDLEKEVKGRVYNSHIEQMFGDFHASMAASYKLRGKEYILHENWKNYYQDALQDGSALKERAAKIGENVVEGFRNYHGGYDSLFIFNLTEGEEALAYRVYGDRFLRDKVAYHAKSQNFVMERAYNSSRNFQIAEIILLSKAQESMGDEFNVDEFKLSFKAFLHKGGEGNFLAQLSIALEEMGQNSDWIAEMMGTNDEQS